MDAAAEPEGSVLTALHSPFNSPKSSHSSSTSVSEIASSSASATSSSSSSSSSKLLASSPSMSPSASTSQPHLRSQRWDCPYECGQHYKRSSGRSIRRHMNVCFKHHNPQAARLDDEELSAVISEQQASGQLSTGLRRWKMRQPRRMADELCDTDRWDCLWGCGKSYRATSSRSIQRHANSCSQRSDGRTGAVDVKRIRQQRRDVRHRQRRKLSATIELASSDVGEVDSSGGGGSSTNTSSAYPARIVLPNHDSTFNDPYDLNPQLMPREADGQAEGVRFDVSMRYDAPARGALLSDRCAAGEVEAELVGVSSNSWQSSAAVPLSLAPAFSSASSSSSSYLFAPMSDAVSHSTLSLLSSSPIAHAPAAAAAAGVDYPLSLPMMDNLPPPASPTATEYLAMFPEPSPPPTLPRALPLAPAEQPAGGVPDSDQQLREQLYRIAAALDELHSRRSLPHYQNLSSTANQAETQPTQQLQQATAAGSWAAHGIGVDSIGINSFNALPSTNASSSHARPPKATAVRHPTNVNHSVKHAHTRDGVTSLAPLPPPQPTPPPLPQPSLPSAQPHPYLSFLSHSASQYLAPSPSPPPPPPPPPLLPPVLLPASLLPSDLYLLAFSHYLQSSCP